MTLVASSTALVETSRNAEVFGKATPRKAQYLGTLTRRRVYRFHVLVYRESSRCNLTLRKELHVVTAHAAQDAIDFIRIDGDRPESWYQSWGPRGKTVEVFVGGGLGEVASRDFPPAREAQFNLLGD